MSYSNDLRKKIIEFIEKGHGITEAATTFGVTRPTIYRWIRLKKTQGNLLDAPTKRSWKKVDPDRLRKLVLDRPDLTLKDYAKHFGTSTMAISKAFKKLKITRKKKTCFYKERDEARRISFLEQIAFFEKSSLVYVDESGIDSYLYRIHGWGPSHERVYGGISGRRFSRESFIAAKCGSRIFAPLCFQGTCNTLLFNEWVEKFLIPELKPGQVVILDNASFHKSQLAREMIEEAGCKLLFLPPYSPDLNPIEKFWAWLKAKVRSLVHNFQTLSDAIDYVFTM